MVAGQGAFGAGSDGWVGAGLGAGAEHSAARWATVVVTKSSMVGDQPTEAGGMELLVSPAGDVVVGAGASVVGGAVVVGSLGAVVGVGGTEVVVVAGGAGVVVVGAGGAVVVARQGVVGELGRVMDRAGKSRGGDANQADQSQGGKGTKSVQDERRGH